MLFRFKHHSHCYRKVEIGIGAIVQGFICAFLITGLMPSETMGQGLQGDSDAVAMARTMIQRMGGAKIWADAKTLYIVEEVHRPNVKLPYLSETWRSLHEPNIRWQAQSSELNRSFARTRQQGWSLYDGTFNRLNETQLRQWRGNWERNVYIMYHRLAKEDSLLRLVKEQERRFAVLNANSGEKLCAFEVSVDGAIVRWSAAFGTDTEEWIYGPLADFGSIRMPAWGVRLQDSYRFYYKEVTLSNAPPPISFEPPSGQGKNQGELSKDNKSANVSAVAQKSSLWGNLNVGAYPVGYKTIDEKDNSRSFPKKSGDAFIPTARNIKIGVWYPAKLSQQTSPMQFRDYLYTMEGASDEKSKRESETRLKTFSIVQELSETAISDLLNMQTASYRDAPPQSNNSTFPLIVFGQGLFYESPITHTVLCEFLASHGYIVATAPLTGAHSPFVKLDTVDLEAQVRDMEFVISRARALPYADKERLAVVGFDMGGLAGSILSMRNSDVDAFISLDSGIIAEHNLRLVKAMPDYDPSRLRIPLLHATHPFEEVTSLGIREDMSFLDAARFSDRIILRLSGVRHADYTSRAMIETAAVKMLDEQTVRRRQSFELVAKYVLAVLNANLKQSRDDAAFLNQADTGNQTVKITKERKAATRAPMTEAEFINRIYTEGAAKVLDLYRKIRKEFPGEQIFKETTINQLGYNRLYRGETGEAINIFILNTEAFPASANVFDSLAEAYMVAGNKQEAIRNYKKSLELDPNNENAKEKLKKLL